MEFKELFHILHNRISDGAEVPDFVRELISMITEVPEEEWGTKLDPSSKRTNENTLRNYSKRGLSKKLAQNIVYHLDPDNFAAVIGELPEATRNLLVSDFSPYDQAADKDNIGEILAEAFVEIIRHTAGIVEASALEKAKRQSVARDLKLKYGEYLCHESGDICPFPGCGKSLIKMNAGKLFPVYEVSLIEKNQPPKIDNLIALCPQCSGTYAIDDNKKITKSLKNIKKLLVAHNQSIDLLDALPLEQGIIGVITKIKKLNQKDLGDLNYDPKTVMQKIPPNEDVLLYTMVNNYVNAYFVRIKEIMTAADKRGQISFEEVQDQIHAMYRKLKRSNKSRVEIFTEISQKIHKVSMMEDIYCQVVVAYFVQSCEVFDAAAE